MRVLVRREEQSETEKSADGVFLPLGLGRRRLYFPTSMLKVFSR